MSIICSIPPSLGMLSSDPLGMPDAEGVGRAVPPSGGAPCFLLTLGVETTGLERGMSEGQSWGLFLGE